MTDYYYVFDCVVFWFINLLNQFIDYVCKLYDYIITVIKLNFKHFLRIYFYSFILYKVALVH